MIYYITRGAGLKEVDGKIYYIGQYFFCGKHFNKDTIHYYGEKTANYDDISSYVDGYDNDAKYNWSRFKYFFCRKRFH